jgi:hypothetical protein
MTTLNLRHAKSGLKMPDNFMMTDRGLFERTMKCTTSYAKLLLQAMTINADAAGVVKGSIEHWSSYLEYPAVPLADIEIAIAQLEAPDPRSTSPDEGGRRIVPMGPNCWRVVNYFKYKYDEAQQRKRAQGAAASARYRARRDNAGVPSETPATPRTYENVPRRKRAGSKDANAEPAPIPEPIAEAWEIWLAFRREKHWGSYAPSTVKSLTTWLLDQADPMAVVQQSIRVGWQSLQELKGSGSNRSGSRSEISDETVAEAERILEDARHGIPIIGERSNAS